MIMKQLIRTIPLLLFPFFLSASSFGAHSLGRTKSSIPPARDLIWGKGQVSIDPPKHPSSNKLVVKICSCQILNLQSNNYQQSDMAIFAERSSQGHFGSDLSIARKTIEREKKHMKSLFYDKLSVLDQVSEPTDCKSLYLKLKMKNNALVIYDILNADIAE
jgi:hypothetical protein